MKKKNFENDENEDEELNVINEKTKKSQFACDFDDDHCWKK